MYLANYRARRLSFVQLTVDIILMVNAAVLEITFVSKKLGCLIGLVMFHRQLSSSGQYCVVRVSKMT